MLKILRKLCLCATLPRDSWMETPGKVHPKAHLDEQEQIPNEKNVFSWVLVRVSDFLVRVLGDSCGCLRDLGACKPWRPSVEVSCLPPSAGLD